VAPGAGSCGSRCRHEGSGKAVSGRWGGGGCCCRRGRGGGKPVLRGGAWGSICCCRGGGGKSASRGVAAAAGAVAAGRPARSWFLGAGVAGGCCSAAVAAAASMCQARAAAAVVAASWAGQRQVCVEGVGRRRLVLPPWRRQQGGLAVAGRWLLFLRPPGARRQCFGVGVVGKVALFAPVLTAGSAARPPYILFRRCFPRAGSPRASPLVLLACRAPLARWRPVCPGRRCPPFPVQALLPPSRS